MGLVARFDKKRGIELVEDLAKHLENKGLKVYVESTLANKISTKNKALPLKEMQSAFLITVGGDGTILRASISVSDTPILAINMGVRGFLTGLNPKNWRKAVDRCLTGDFNLEKCMKLSISFNDRPFPDALNGVLITTDECAKLLYAKIKKDDGKVLNFQADGLMGATQTGSTGYSLSAGGPVLDPELDAFVMTPVCPLRISRSIFFPSGSTLKVRILRPKKSLIVIDGQHRKFVNSNQEITVTRSKHFTPFIRFQGNFYHRLSSRIFFRGTGGKSNG